ncbi:MAG: dipeptide epimerase [Lachnospiraceae bacterium]|nr:dipeptide epimerase [Lachnospiraceae bacterium]
MKITGYKLYQTDIPLHTPFKTSLREVDAVRDLIVAIETDTGERGFGEAPPTAVITGETLPSITGAIRDFILPSILGMEIEGLDEIERKLHGCMVKNTSAKAAVDMALYDLYAKNLGKPLYQVLGGSKNAFETDITISVNPVAEMVQDSLTAVARGFRILKVKVGREGMRDVSRIAAIREAVGKEITIRVDANQGYEAKEAVRIITAMEDKDLSIELVEQPVPARDFQGMCYITEHVSTPILADESVFSPLDAVRLLENRAADMINIKLMKTGGIHEALKLCAISETYGVPCMIGCMLESKISVSAAAHLAAAKGVITMADLDGPSLCRTDPYPGGPLFEGSMIRMPSEAGIGIKDIVEGDCISVLASS